MILFMIKMMINKVKNMQHNKTQQRQQSISRSNAAPPTELPIMTGRFASFFFPSDRHLARSGDGLESDEQKAQNGFAWGFSMNLAVLLLAVLGMKLSTPPTLPPP